MSIFKTTIEKNVKGKVKKVFNDIKKTRKINKIPNFWKSLANNPDNLETVSYTHLTLPTKA